MMNKLGFYTHSEERRNKIPVNGGRMIIERREKFCAEHGWIDVFAIGGDIEWHKQHAKCDQTEEESSTTPIITFRQAA